MYVRAFKQRRVVEGLLVRLASNFIETVEEAAFLASSKLEFREEN